MPDDKMPKDQGRGDGPDKNGRRCVITNETGPVETLIRLVLGPEGVFVPDVAARLPGRGVWVKADGPLIEAAVLDGRLFKAASRSLKCKLPKGAVPDGLVAQMDQLVLRRCLDRLGLEQRAGHLVPGFDKIKAVLGKKAAVHPFAIVEAIDGSEDGRRKILAMIGADVPVIALFDREALSKALGRENVVHVLLFRSGGTEKLMADVSRLLGLRGCAPLSSEA